MNSASGHPPLAWFSAILESWFEVKKDPVGKVYVALVPGGVIMAMDVLLL